MKLIHEVFDEFTKAPDRKSKVEVLRRNDSFALKSVLRGTFHPNIRYTIDRIPYYKVSDAPDGLGYTTIHNELDRVYLFEEGHPRVSPNLTKQRKEQLLIQMLESMEKQEAEIFMNMLLKKQTVPDLNPDIIEEAFPGLLSVA